MIPDWLEQAACRGIDTELWFSDDKEDQRAVKRVCQNCPVVWQCLDDALATDENTAWGIRAGLTGRERRTMRQAQQVPTFSKAQREAQKAATVALTEQGHSITAIARDLGVDKRTIIRWRREFKAAA